MMQAWLQEAFFLASGRSRFHCLPAGMASAILRCRGCMEMVRCTGSWPAIQQIKKDAFAPLFRFLFSS